MRMLAEAALLGLASGPACLASCGPVLVPSLAACGEGTRATARQLGVFLLGRLAGYLAFSVLAWGAGMAIPEDRGVRALLFGVVNLGLAALLVAYAMAMRRRAVASPASRLVKIGKGVKSWTPAGLGLLTGLNVCPPFLVAGARAAETRSLTASVLFFAVFFLGTAVWSLPLVATGGLRRWPEVAMVARLTLLVLAVWYAYLGLMTLVGRFARVS
jgi:sulfite exporter TauE/SafE